MSAGLGANRGAFGFNHCAVGANRQAFGFNHCAVGANRRAFGFNHCAVGANRNFKRPVFEQRASYWPAPKSRPAVVLHSDKE